MPAKTTVKVATLNNAAKDDYFGNLDFMAEDHELAGFLDVLGNDPGSAKLIGVSQYLPTNSGHLVNTGSSFTPDGFTASISVTLAGGQLHIDASALNPELQALGEGQTRSITFYYTAQMANGAYSTAKVTIDIHGENDDPTFGSGGLSGAVADTADDDDYDAVTGSVTASDVDTNDAGLLVFGLADGEDGLSDYGSFAIDSDGDWTFTPDDSAVEGLKTTETVSFDIVVEDGHGGSATQTVTITLNGVNDTPEFGGDDEGEVTEDGTTSTGGTLTVADRDTADLGFLATTSALAGTYGDFTFTAATGEWTYTLRNGDANVQALGAGDQPTDTLTVYSADGTAHTITVTVNGAYDAPPPPPPPSGPVVPPDNGYANSAANDQDDPSVISALAGAIIITDVAPTQTNLPNNPAVGDKAIGTGGDQKINGRQGDDLIHGGGGNDEINGNDGNDTLWGGSGNDKLNGGSGAENIYGGSGNDDIAAGGGADHIWGGTGQDDFKFAAGDSTAAATDTLHDFSRVEGDKIDLSAFAGLSWGGIMSSSGDLGAGKVGYVVNGDSTLTVFADTDGIAGYSAADLMFVVAGTSNLVAGDFIGIAP